MTDEVMFSLVMFKDGTVEVQYQVEGKLKIVKLRPRHPAIVLLPLFSTLGLAIGSDIILQQHVKALVQKLEETPNGSEKKYDPHIIIVWLTEKNVAVKEFPYKEDAQAKYDEILATGTRAFWKVALVKIVRVHGEG